MILQVGSIDLVSGATALGGLGVAAGGTSMLVAAVFRWRVGQRAPAGLTVLAGLTIVALYLNTTAALGQAITGSRGLFDLDAALLNTATFAMSAIAAYTGREVGDRAVRSVRVVISPPAVATDADLARIVRSVGRVITVTLPETIDDLDGYDPVASETKDALAGSTFIFPRGLTVAELRDRLVTRLKRDYPIGHVQVELDAVGTVTDLGIGRRAAGLGPTLAPGTVAAAVYADPPFSASSGDIVQLWSSDADESTRITAELRATVDDMVTIALDERDAERLTPDDRYRLLTLPADPPDDRAFAHLLRSTDETFGVATIEAESDLNGIPVGALDVNLIARKPATGTIDVLPPSQSLLGAGETVYAIARPERLRRLQSLASAEGTG